MMHSTVQDDDHDYNEDCENGGGGCDNVTGNYDIRYLMFDTITAADDEEDNGGVGSQALDVWTDFFYFIIIFFYIFTCSVSPASLPCH